jgi:hypothetical protein
MQAFGWFLGENDLQTPLIDPDTGSCSDGLHPDRPNENKGAESVLSYLLGLVEVRKFKRANMGVRTSSASALVQSTANLAFAARTISGSSFVPIPILQSPKTISASGSYSGRRQTLQAGD